jgi:hypothetical protein
MPAKLHLAENTLALHLLFQRLEGLIDVIIANENLHACSSRIARTGGCSERPVAQIGYEAGARPAEKSPRLLLERAV